VPPILPPVDGFLMLDKTKFAESFAGTYRPRKLSSCGLSGALGIRRSQRTRYTPAWKTKPSWYLVVTEDKMIPPPAQQFMSQRAGSTVKEVGGSHAIYVSKPQTVADIIEEAATRSSRQKLKRPNNFSWARLGGMPTSRRGLCGAHAHSPRATENRMTKRRTS